MCEFENKTELMTFVRHCNLALIRDEVLTTVTAVANKSGGVVTLRLLHFYSSGNKGRYIFTARSGGGRVHKTISSDCVRSVNRPVASCIPTIVRLCVLMFVIVFACVSCFRVCVLGFLDKLFKTGSQNQI